MIASCKKQDEEIKPRPKGKYLSEIRKVNGENDTTEYMKLIYDDNRYLSELQYYNKESGHIYTIEKFYFNIKGKLIRIEYFDVNNMIISKKEFEYIDNRIASSIMQDWENDEWKTLSKVGYKVDSMGHPIKIFGLVFEDQEWHVMNNSTNFSYDTNGNILKSEYSDFKFHYFYDEKINPFYNIGIDFIHDYSWIPYMDYLPSNNVVKSIHVNNYTGDSDTIYNHYIYEGDYPVREKLYSDCYYVFYYADL